ncbi:hypothetical protein CLV90_2039 [Maribacter spongiicola]|uniref:Uncharacterized protein n=1 Tax=Maribacter spongiicola TaxID=1206753 RepID=A0A4R7K277_9FLAO|nr:hypothetical protein [Maribacter spongiicola]TDT44960.1 hypothetical protein CLV90_2039 [Maribacter spongiicola]
MVKYKPILFAICIVFFIIGLLLFNKSRKADYKRKKKLHDNPGVNAYETYDNKLKRERKEKRYGCLGMVGVVFILFSMLVFYWVLGIVL